MFDMFISPRRSLDSDQITLAVGFGDGVVRLLKELKDGLQLLHVFKPHTLPISTMSFTQDGDTLATGSQDGTVFFMSIKKNAEGHASELTPIGFVHVGGAVTDVAWCPDGSKLLVCIVGVGLVEMDRPVESELDTQTTFEITLQQKVFPFELKRVVPEKPAPQEGEDGEEAPEPEPEPEIPPTGDATACLWVSTASFLVCYDGIETTGKVYECSFDNKYPIRELPTHTGPVSFLKFSHGMRFLITGSVDGQVGVRPIGQGTASDFFFLNKCWRGHVHGIDSRVTGASLSFDEGKLLTSGMDGNVNMFSVGDAFVKEVKDACSAAQQALRDAEAQAEALKIEELKAKEEV